MILSLVSLTQTVHAQSNVPSLQFTPSITITNIDSPNTPIKQGESFATIVMIENTYSTPQDIEIRFDIENTGITKPEPDLIKLTSGSNERKYNFETSQNIIPGNYVVNIQLWSNPNPDGSILTVLPKLLDKSNFEIIIEEPIQMPQSPLRFDAKAISPYEIQLLWQKPIDDGGSDITGYKIEYYEGNFDDFKILEPNIKPDSTTYNHIDLKPETKYTYRISAMNSAGTSEPSNDVSATTLEEEIIHPVIIILETDKSTYRSDDQNNIIIKVTGEIENHYSDITIVEITLEKSNNPGVSAISQHLDLKDDGTFQTQFHLDPKKFTTGSYIIKAAYDNQKKSTDFGIIQNLGSAPNLIVPTNIIKTANDPHGAYIDPSVVTAIDKENGTLKPECEPQLGWFAIGEYTINCTVTDYAGNSDQGSFKIKIKNAHPVSKISVLSSDDSFEIDKTIYFSAEDSYDPDGGTIIQYIWNFSDGNSPIITTSPEISHPFKKEGTFNVSVDVIDDENSRSNQSSTVKISVSANYIWIIVVILVCAAAGGGGVIAAKYLLKPKSKISTHQDLSTDNNSKTDNESKKQPPIDMDIEFRSGIEKK